MQKMPVLLTAFAVITAAAQTPQLASNSEMQNPKAKLSDAVSTLLNFTNLARTAIANNDRKLARQHLDQAVQAANQLGKARRMVPMYTELNQNDVLQAVEEYQRSAPASPDTVAWQDLAGGPRRRKPSSPEMTRVAVDYTTVAIEAHMAQTHLKAARQVLGRGNVEAADEALAAVQGAVVMESNSAELPLLRARRNLVWARRQAGSGDYEHAQADLQAACQALSEYHSQGGPHSSDAAALRNDIDRYHASAQDAGAAEQIEAWWKQTTDWATPAVASMAAPDTGGMRRP